MSRTKKKGCNPLVGILVLGSIFLIGIVVSFFVGKIMLNNWVQGEGLQALIKSKTEAQIKANIDIDEVKWEGMKAYVGSLSARGYEDAAFSKLNINGVRLDFDGVKDQAFNVPYINVSQAKAEISDDRLAGLFPMPEASDAGWFRFH